ncbi:MAG: hypothetical protein FWG75_08515 [Cystobacterineae bacterium]|nr:hypothetical protein [Cystobacterineae bacterium]
MHGLDNPSMERAKRGKALPAELPHAMGTELRQQSVHICRPKGCGYVALEGYCSASMNELLSTREKEARLL